MRKPRGSGSGADRPPAESVTIPRTINLACAALAAAVLVALIRALGLLGSTNALARFLKHANDISKTPKKNYTLADAANDVPKLRQSAFINFVLLAVLIAMLIWGLRRTRSASPSRWVLLVVFVFTQLPLYIIPSAGYPAGLPFVARAAGLLMGAFSIVAVLLIFVPAASQRYFRDARQAATPPELRGQPRPGLGSLFSPRPRGGAAGAGAATRGRAATRPAETRPAQARSAARGKGRADVDAVAKGAELARTRAKATRSKRSAG